MNENKTRVLMLAHVFPRALDDSMGAFLLHLADALAEQGARIDVVAPHAANLADVESFGAIRVWRFHYAPTRWEQLAYTGTMHEFVARGIVNKILFAFFNITFFFKAMLVVRATSAQLLHAHWWLPGGLVGALVSLITRVPLVITTHGTDVEMLRRTRWAIPLARFVFARARAITCGSTYMRAQLLALGVADAAKVRVIPMPIAEEFKSQKTESRSRNSVLTVARLTAQKSIDTLIDAIALVPRVRLKIIGDGPERAALEQHARDLNLQDRVEFIGALPQKDLPSQYVACTVFVLPSVREGMGLVLAEALLCGAPVIAANSGGVTDIVRNGETGLLFPERDARALADTIEKLLNDRALAVQLATNGAALVRERFTHERVAARFAEIYGTPMNADPGTCVPARASVNADKIENRRFKIPWRRILGYILALAVLFFLGRVLVQTWGEIAASGFRFGFDMPALLVSLGLLVVARGFAVEAWRRILISLGEQFDFGFGARVWFLSNLTRYIPGNIWQVATMMVMVGERGVSKTNALLSQVIYTALALAIAGLLGVTFVLARPDLFSTIVPSFIAAYVPLIVALAFAALIVAFALPITNRAIVALTARVLRREIVAPTPTFARGLVPPLFSLLMWLTNGLAFYLFVSSITPLSFTQLPTFVAMNAGAYWVGYLSFITPSGLGFREGALALMLATFFPTPVAVALSLVTRLWSTVGEILGVSLIWIAQGSAKTK